MHHSVRLSIWFRRPFVVETHRRLMSLEMLHTGRFGTSMMPITGAVVALVNDEYRQQYRHDGEIGHTLTLVNQQRCQEEIVQEEKQQIDYKLPPDNKHLRPVECDILVTDGADIQTQEWGCEKQSPHHQVNDVLLS